MAKDLVTMSSPEIDRMQVIQRVLEKRLTQAQGGVLLGLGARQMGRLCRGVKQRGPQAVVSKKRGRPSNRRLPDLVQTYAVGLVNDHYNDFGPTLALEKLREIHGVMISRETLRSWMISADIWKPRAQRNAVVHQPRSRRACRGELIQIDGSAHAWFEARGDKCSLLVFIDDATGEIMELRFVEVESAFDYFAATQSYVERHGRPVAFYSDKHSIFRVNHDGATGQAKGVTQFGRALADLNIDIICANSPQAKGRVERMNKTLQDRLVKELRLAGINNATDANAFVPQFISDYNRRFAKTPRSTVDAHRPLQTDKNLGTVFSWQEARKVSKNLVLQFQRSSYLISPDAITLGIAGQMVRVHQWADGRVEIRHNDQPLAFTLFDKSPHVNQGEVVENKRLGAVLAVIQQRQKTRDEVRLQSKKFTLRQKARIRAQQEQAAQAAPLASSPPPHAYADFAEYFKDFEQQQKDRTRRYNEAAKQRRAAAQPASTNPSPPA